MNNRHYFCESFVEFCRYKGIELTPYQIRKAEGFLDSGIAGGLSMLIALLFAFDSGAKDRYETLRRKHELRY